MVGLYELFYVKSTCAATLIMDVKIGRTGHLKKRSCRRTSVILKLLRKSSFSVRRNIKFYVFPCIAVFFNALNLCLHLKEERKRPMGGDFV